MSAQNLLPGQTIIVTGAATGIGQAFAFGAAAQGAHVIVADMNSADETMDRSRRPEARLPRSGLTAATTRRFGPWQRLP